MKALTLLCLVLLTGCQSTDQNARTLLDRIEFGEDEIGCVDLRATIDLNPLPMFTSNASLILKKTKGDNPPEC